MAWQPAEYITLITQVLGAPADSRNDCDCAAVLPRGATESISLFFPEKGARGEGDGRDTLRGYN